MKNFNKLMVIALCTGCVCTPIHAKNNNSNSSQTKNGKKSHKLRNMLIVGLTAAAGVGAGAVAYKKRDLLMQKAKKLQPTASKYVSNINIGYQKDGIKAQQKGLEIADQKITSYQARLGKTDLTDSEKTLLSKKIQFQEKRKEALNQAIKTNKIHIEKEKANINAQNKKIASIEIEDKINKKKQTPLSELGNASDIEKSRNKIQKMENQKKDTEQEMMDFKTKEKKIISELQSEQGLLVKQINGLNKDQKDIKSLSTQVKKEGLLKEMSEKKTLSDVALSPPPAIMTSTPNILADPLPQ